MPGTVSIEKRTLLTTDDRLSLLESEMIAVMRMSEKFQRFMWAFSGFCIAVSVIWSVIGGVIAVKIGEISTMSTVLAVQGSKMEHFMEDQRRQDADIARALVQHDKREDQEIQQQRRR